MFVDRKKNNNFYVNATDWCPSSLVRRALTHASQVSLCYSMLIFMHFLTFFVHVLHFVIRHSVYFDTQFLCKCMSDQAGFTVLSLNTDIVKNEEGMSTKIINFITSGTGVPMFGRRSYSENASLIKISSFLLSGADKHNEYILIHITSKKWSIQNL